VAAGEGLDGACTARKLKKVFEGKAAKQRTVPGWTTLKILLCTGQQISADLGYPQASAPGLLIKIRLLAQTPLGSYPSLAKSQTTRRCSLSCPGPSWSQYPLGLQLADAIDNLPKFSAMSLPSIPAGSAPGFIPRRYKSPGFNVSGEL
jgi:hypothetical protein